VSNGAHNRTERTRQAILSAAEDLFLNHGFLSVSMDQIAEAGTVSKQTVYAHFQSKEALFLAVANGMMGAAGDDLMDRDPDSSDDRSLEEYLLEFARQQLTIVLTPRLMQLRRLLIGEAARFPELGRTLHKMGSGRSIRRLEYAFERYRTAGRLEAKDLHAAASNFNWLVMGAPVNDAMMLGDAAIRNKRKLAEHATECVRIFVAAYGVRRGR
jgi:TetR/AcrR family transcriptional regulator, mexJK operon transcriptional repressor